MALFLPAATAMPQRPVFSEPLSYPGLQLRIAAVIKQLIVNHAVRRVVSVVIYAGLIGLAMTIAYYTGPVFHPTVHPVPYQLPAVTP